MLEFEWRYPRVDVDWAPKDDISVFYIEGWKFDKDPGVEGDPVAWRYGSITHHDELLDWVHQRGDFKPLTPKDNEDWGACHGGFRLLVCDRTRFWPVTVTIDEHGLDALGNTFGLLPESIPVLTQAEGGMRYRFQRKGTPKAKSLEVLIQANQILKVANFMISMSFDFDSRWTSALAIVENDGDDAPFERRLRHVLTAAANNRGLWAHPTFLPTVFSRHYGDEMRESRAILRSDITHINRRLGVSTARSFRPEELPDDWPENLDFRWLITNSYARRVEVMQVREGCKWSCKSLQFLRDLESEITKEGIIEGDASHNMQKTVEYHLSIIEGTEGRFATLQEESEASTTMLFNAINQRDSIIAQRYNDIQKRIATSTKEDSISMTTFTFITALFLPGTFICALLSLTMIQWQPDFLSASTNPITASTTSASTSTSADSALSTSNITISVNDDPSGAPEVSTFFWVFWAIDIPLTFLVMLGWYLWFKRTKRTWMRENHILLDPAAGTGDDSGSEKSAKRVSVSSGSASGSSRTSRRSGSVSSRATGSIRSGTDGSVRSRRSGSQRSRKSNASNVHGSGDEADKHANGNTHKNGQTYMQFKAPRRTTTWKTDDEIEIFDNVPAGHRKASTGGDAEKDEKKSLSVRIEPISRRSTGFSTGSQREKDRDRERKEKEKRGSIGTGEKLERVVSSRSEGDKGTGKRLRRVTESKVGESEDDNDNDEKKDGKLGGESAGENEVQKSFASDLRDRLAKARRGGRKDKDDEGDLEKGRE